MDPKDKINAKYRALFEQLQSSCVGEFRVNYSCSGNQADLELASYECPGCSTRFFVITIDVGDEFVELVARKAVRCPFCGTRLQEEI